MHGMVRMYALLDALCLEQQLAVGAAVVLGVLHTDGVEALANGA